MNDIQSVKIKELAQTLKRNGLAGSDTEAMRMAESMTTTEDRVNKNFEDKKSSMVRNYDFEKAKNGASTYGSNPSNGIQSQIRSAASAIGDPRTTEASTRVDTPRQVSNVQSQETTGSQSWEKEAATQEQKVGNQQVVEQQTAPVSPPSYESNGAINNAINKVQERFAQQSAQQVNPELPAGLTLNEAASHEEFVEQAQAEESPAPAPVQTQQAPEQTQVAPPAQEEPLQEAEKVPIQESPAPAPIEQEEVVVDQQAQNPIVEHSLPQPQQAQAEESPAPAPVQTQQAPEQAQAGEQREEAPQQAEEEEMLERTQEMPTNPQAVRDTSKFAESTISLADVFNVNKKA